MTERTVTPSSPEPAKFHEQYGDNMVSFLPDDDDYRIKLSVFEGPVDLLLYLIKRKELDIHEISLSEIVGEYLEYVDLIKLIDIERAGDFIVVASTLMKIKSRSLFASPGSETDDSDEDPRDSLIKYLMEYEKLGEVAEKLAEKEDTRRGVFPRGGEKSRIAKYIEEKETAPDYMLFDLLTALQDVLKTAPKEATHKVELLNVTMEMKQREILAALERHGKIDFIKMVRGQPRIVIVITFVAMLELIKNRIIQVRQSKQFSRIILTKRIDKDEL